MVAQVGNDHETHRGGGRDTFGQVHILHSWRSLCCTGNDLSDTNSCDSDLAKNENTSLHAYPGYNVPSEVYRVFMWEVIALYMSENKHGSGTFYMIGGVGVWRESRQLSDPTQGESVALMWIICDVTSWNQKHGILCWSTE